MASLWGQVAHWKEESRIASQSRDHWFERCHELTRSESGTKHQLNKCKDELRKKTEKHSMLFLYHGEAIADNNQLRMSYNELREQSDEHLKAKEVAEEELEAFKEKIKERDAEVLATLLRVRECIGHHDEATS